MKKLNTKEKKQIREEFLRGIPDYALKQATEDFVEEIKMYMKRYILSDKSKSSKEQKDAMIAAQESLDSLEVKVNDLLDEHLYMFIRNV